MRTLRSRHKDPKIKSTFARPMNHGHWPGASSLPPGLAGIPDAKVTPEPPKVQHLQAHPCLRPCPPTSPSLSPAGREIEIHLQAPTGTVKENENLDALQKAFAKVIHGPQQRI